ncbi:MAG: hypothetical protein ACRD0I_04025 [Acidimicrobiales bacterium]
MASDRYVLLGLAPARAAWFRSISQWANSSSVPVEFTKCISIDELKARLSSNRVHSAVLVDGRISGLDRDLVGLAAGRGCPTLIVGEDRHRTWLGLGVRSVINPDFSRQELIDQLNAHAKPISLVEASTSVPQSRPVEAKRGRLLAVCGPGGTGASTVAIALAQVVSHRVRSERARSHRVRSERARSYRVRSHLVRSEGTGSEGTGSEGTGSEGAVSDRPVALVDLARRSDQAMLHDSLDIVPSIQELVDAYRHANPSPTELSSFGFNVVERGYHLFLGLRNPWSWSAIQPRAFDAALNGLLASYDTVVCDVDSDFEGEAQSGSPDIADRNHMARRSVTQADVIVAVGQPGMKGVLSLRRLLDDLDRLGVAGPSVLPVINRAPRGHRHRDELTKALLTGSDTDQFAHHPPLTFVPEIPMEQVHRDCVALPGAITQPLQTALAARFVRPSAEPAPPGGPEPIAPGSLGHWGPAEIDVALR